MIWSLVSLQTQMLRYTALYTKAVFYVRLFHAFLF